MKGAKRALPLVLLAAVFLFLSLSGCTSARHKCEDFKHWFQTDVARF